MWFKKNEWPEINFDEIKKRSRLVVIDDDVFPYKTLFEKDGYLIEKWDDVKDLGKLESEYFDIILLDIQGVGVELAADQGLGILRHLRKVSPSQIIIAYSNADWSLKYQDFFKMADCTLAKTADYVEFKRTVDEFIKKRFSLDFYVNKIQEAISSAPEIDHNIASVARGAILKRSPNKLKKYLEKRTDNAEIVKKILTFVECAIKIMNIAIEVVKSGGQN